MSYSQGSRPFDLAGTTADIGMVEFVIEPNGKILFEKYIAEIEYKPKILEL